MPPSSISNATATAVQTLTTLPSLISNATLNATSSASLVGGDQHSAHYKTIGLTLAITSGVFIGSSFVFKKKGLLASNALGSVAGEGHAYLKSSMWWLGMILMIVGEICNFVAYAFTQAILVTPLGALSVVISAVLSSIFLRERLSFTGKVGCFHCIIGATIIVLHAPDQKMTDSGIESFMNLALNWGFLLYTAIVSISSGWLIWWAGPRWGKKNMMVYIGVCSLVGSLSVVSTQGLGNAIVNAIATHSWDDFTRPFMYILIVFVVSTLLIEINYLNKALNLFCTAMVTPIYYVTFTSATIIASAILFQGFSAPATDIVTIVLGFLIICSGILLLQTSKSKGTIKPDMTAAEVLAPNPTDEKTASEIGYVDPGPAEMRANPFDTIRRLSRRYSNELQAAQQDYVRRRSTSVSISGFSNPYFHTLQHFGNAPASIGGKADNRKSSVSNAYGSHSSFEHNWHTTLLEDSVPPVPSLLHMRSLTDRVVDVPAGEGSGSGSGGAHFSPSPSSHALTISIPSSPSSSQPSPTNNNPYLNHQYLSPSPSSSSSSSFALAATPSMHDRSLTPNPPPNVNSTTVTPLSSIATLTSRTSPIARHQQLTQTSALTESPSPVLSKSSPLTSRLDSRVRDRRSHSFSSHLSRLDLFKVGPKSDEEDLEELMNKSSSKSIKSGWNELDGDDEGNEEFGGTGVGG